MDNPLQSFNSCSRHQDGVLSAFTLLLCGTGVKQILNISIEDVAITKDIVAAGKLLSVEVLDHLIIGKAKYVSLKERGLGFS